MTEKTENRKGYKKTKLGWIPEDWEVVKLSSICQKIIGGGTPSTLNNDFWKGNIPWISSSDINNYGNINIRKYISQKAIDNSATNIIPSGSVIVVTRVGLGKVALSDFDLCTSQDFQSIIVNNNFVINKYLKLCISNLIDRIINNCQGSTIKGITKDQISNLDLLLPKKVEQEKIAEILSTWDDGIETLEKLIKKKEIQHKALMKALLKGKIRFLNLNKTEYKKNRLGLMPIDWQIKPLKLLFEKKAEKYSENIKYNVFTNSATKGVVLQNEYFDRNIVTEENTNNYYLVDENDFMYNPRISQNAPAGPINRNKLGIKGIASPIYTIFKAKKDTNIDFYEYYFISNLWNKSIFMVSNQGARHDRLNITNNDFLNIPLPYPPIKEQQIITEILNNSEKEIELLNSKLKKLKKQKKGLMQKLLTGEIRVKV